MNTQDRREAPCADLLRLWKLDHRRPSGVLGNGPPGHEERFKHSDYQQKIETQSLDHYQYDSHPTPSQAWDFWW